MSLAFFLEGIRYYHKQMFSSWLVQAHMIRRFWKGFEGTWQSDSTSYAFTARISSALALRRTIHMRAMLIPACKSQKFRYTVQLSECMKYFVINYIKIPETLKVWRERDREKQELSFCQRNLIKIWVCKVNSLEKWAQRSQRETALLQTEYHPNFSEYFQGRRSGTG